MDTSRAFYLNGFFCSILFFLTSINCSYGQNLVLGIPNVLNILSAADGVMAVGMAGWKLVQAGKPVYTSNLTESVSVIPDLQGGNPALNQMSHWSRPIVKTYSVDHKNAFGTSVVKFTFSIIYQYGGQYKGAGRYLNGLKVIASDVQVLFGFKFDASSKLLSVSNVGSAADPVAAATFQIDYTFKNLVSTENHSVKFFIDGENNCLLIK